MCHENLTPRERQIYTIGYREGKKDGKYVVTYLFIGYLIIFGLVIKLLAEK